MPENTTDNQRQEPSSKTTVTPVDDDIKTDSNPVLEPPADPDIEEEEENGPNGRRAAITPNGAPALGPD